MYKKYKIIKKTQKGGNEYYDTKLHDDPHNTILELELMHDQGKSKIKNKDFLNMLTLDDIKITNTNIEDVEGYLREKIIDYSIGDDTETLKNFFNSNIVNDIKKQKITLNEYKMVFDNSRDNKPVRITLEVLFNLKDSKNTFIGICEKMLRSKNIKISNDKFIENNKLKEFYLLEAIQIGFDPIDKNKLINYNIFHDLDDYEKKILSYYKKDNIKNINLEEKYILGLVNNLDKFMKEIQLTLNVLKNIFNVINNQSSYNLSTASKLYLGKYILKVPILSITAYINNIFDNDLTLIEKFKLLIEERIHYITLIYSMKEARDTYYLEEIKNMIQKDNIKPIFITLDRILAYRCILYGISVIHYSINGITILGINKDDNINIIGNPFELFIRNDQDNEMINKYNTQDKKDLINKIINNPIITLQIQKGGNIEFKDLQFNFNDINTTKLDNLYDDTIVHNIYKLSLYIDTIDDLIKIIFNIENKYNKSSKFIDHIIQIGSKSTISINKLRALFIIYFYHLYQLNHLDTPINIQDNIKLYKKYFDEIDNKEILNLINNYFLI